MGRAQLAVIALALAGCDLVFAPGHGPGGDPGDPDGPIGRDPDALGPSDDAPPGTPDAENPCSPGQTPTKYVLDAVEDTMVVQNFPTMNFGSGGLVHVGADYRSRGLFRFLVPAEPSPPIEMDLELHYARNQDDCGASCVSCAALERAGLLSAFAMSDDWVEGEADWFLRFNGAQWTQPGADQAGADHSVNEVVADHPALGSAQFGWDLSQASEAWTWRSGSTISFLVVPHGDEITGTVMIATSRDGAANACLPDDAPATLTLLFCQ